MAAHHPLTSQPVLAPLALEAPVFLQLFPGSFQTLDGPGWGSLCLGQ